MTSFAPFATTTRSAIPLVAGPWSLLYENGYVRTIGIGGSEAVRRIYLSVRDENWNSIAGELSDFSLERGEREFTLAFSCRNRRNEVNFLWRAEISGSADGLLSFAMTGEALATFKQKRIGFCVLHPPACKGIPCVVETDDGCTISSAFPVAIAPQTLFTRIRSMRYRFAPECCAVIEFEGELFETEDQRNWTDATIKTYAPPQHPPRPELIAKGTIIRQKVTIRPEGRCPAPSTGPGPSFTGPIRIDLSTEAGSPSRPMPRVGLTYTRELPLRAAELLRKAAPAHLRVGLRFHELPVESEAARAALCHGRHGIPLECAVTFTDDFRSEADHLVSALSAAKVRVVRFLVYHRRGPSALGAVAGPVCATLGKAFPQAQVSLGTDGYFVEINRAHPPLEPGDGICYSATPQVHTFDDVAVMENLPGLFETIESARSFASGTGVVLSPLTLRPRKRPELPAKDGGPDARQTTLFAAAWMLGSLAWCLRGGASSVTLGEISGPGGVMAADGAEVYPCWFALAGMTSLGESARVMQSGDDRSPVLGLAGDRISIVANVSGEPVRVGLTGLAGSWTCSILDEASVGRIKTAGDPISALRGGGSTVREGSVEFELPPHGLAFLFLTIGPDQQ